MLFCSNRLQERSVFYLNEDSSSASKRFYFKMQKSRLLCLQLRNVSEWAHDVQMKARFIYVSLHTHQHHTW